MELNRISDIAAFIAAVKEGSYTKAAGTLGLTRSAVGKSITRLEARFGLRLLNRTSRKLTLTEEGAIMYDRCRQILEDLEDVESIMEQRRGKPSGTLRLTAPLSLGLPHVLPVLEAYLAKWPDLRADVAFTDRLVDLIEEGFDIAIRIGAPSEDPRIMTRTIAMQRMITCASPVYLQRKGAPVTPHDLKMHDSILFMNGNRIRSWQFETPQGIFEFRGPGKLHIDSTEAMLHSALAGYGITHLPRRMLNKYLEEGKLIQILESCCEKPEPVRVIYPTRRNLSPRIRMFIDLLVDSWEESVPWPGAAKR